MSDRDAWEKAESLSKILAAAAIPFFLGIATLMANQALEKSKNREELLKQAIDVVFLSKSDQMAGADKSFESRRAHRSYWLEIYNSLADVKLSNDFIAVMMEQDAKADGTPLYWTGDRVLLQIMKDQGPRARMRMNSVTVGLPLDTSILSVTRDEFQCSPERRKARWHNQTKRDHPRTLERELTVKQPQFGRSARLCWYKPRSSVGRRVRQGDRLAARWASTNLGLHRNRAVPRDNEGGCRFRAARHVRCPIVVPVKLRRYAQSAASTAGV